MISGSVVISSEARNLLRIALLPEIEKSEANSNCNKASQVKKNRVKKKHTKNKSQLIDI